MKSKQKSKLIKYSIIFAGLFSLFLLAGCVEEERKDTTRTPVKVGETNFETTDGIKKFESVDDIREFLESQQNQPSYYGGGIMARSFDDGADFAVMAVEESAAAPQAATKSSADSGGASDFSETNVQVKGVDEADYVKNDGKYIYIVSGNKLVIVDAFPADDAKIVSEIEIGETSNSKEGNRKIAPYYGFTTSELFINGDRLVVFGHSQDESFILGRYDIIPRPRYTQRTHAYVYDISDRSEPELIRDFNLNGNYFDARMIEDYVYFIVKDNVYFYNDIIDVPIIRDASEVVVQPDIFYFDNPEGNYVYHTVASFDITDADEIEAKTFMMGWSNTLFVSKENIYITYQKNVPYYWHRNNQETRFFEVVVPLLPQEQQIRIEAIADEKLSDYEKWNKISNVIEEMYNSMSEQEKENIMEEVNEAIEEHEIKQEMERRKTIVHKINIDEGSITYDTKGEVPGHVLNQFSMDEYEGNLRIATTTFVWNARDNTMYNNVFVLDEDLEMIGALEDIAPEERIYSARFIGDRLYMVTFKNIDPFFVIDLSDPTQPSILGELKIPGFSDYLHPYDENHIIGIGKETEGNQWGGVSTKGVKLALFDVTDVKNPKQVDKYEIGKSGTDSEALRDHKAFLFDKEKDLLVIPVREVTGRFKDPQYGYFRNQIWQGAYVFSLSPDVGFELSGKITHDSDESDEYYWNSPSAVKRSLYMDEVLYTISQRMIKMNDLDDVTGEINTVQLPYEDPRRNYPEPVPFIGRGVPEIDGDFAEGSDGIAIAVESEVVEIEE